MQRNNSRSVWMMKSTMLLTVLFCFLSVSSANAQYFPTFGTSYGSYVPGVGTSTLEGVAVTTVPASTQATELLAVFNVGYPTTATSTDGINWGNSAGIFTSEYCDLTSHATRCSPAIVNFQGTPYLAFWDLSNNLEVWQGQLVGGGNDAYTWTQVYNQYPGNGGMISSPQMVEYNGKLFIIYAVNSLVASGGSTIHNALQETVFDPSTSTWSTTNAGLGYVGMATPVQVGLSVMNGTLYMVAQQNNSTRYLWYWSSSDGYNWTGAAYTPLYVDSGLSMVTYNSNLVFAGKQNSSQDHIFLFSSSNGSTWYGQQQSPLMHELTTPTMTLWNGGIQMLYIDHSGGGLFYSTFAPY